VKPTGTNPTTATVTKARNGVWTPWARVLCVECDYAALKDSPRAAHYDKHLQAVAAMNRTEEVPQPDGHELATCDTCRCPCWTRTDVALLQQVGLRSSDIDWEGPFGWELEQTGGMCCALVFETEGREVVVTAMDGEFFVGEYKLVDEDDDDRWTDPLHTWKSESLYAGEDLRPSAELGALADQCARKVVDFIRHPETSA
jgi:hypothetical protein